MRCTHEHPCDCGGPADLARAERAVAVEVLADHLRRSHQKACGITTPLPWSALTRSEQRRWSEAAEDAIHEREQAA